MGPYVEQSRFHPQHLEETTDRSVEVHALAIAVRTERPDQGHVMRLVRGQVRAGKLDAYVDEARAGTLGHVATQQGPLALYLAAAGIGRIGLVDFDVVDFTNLQRQVIHFAKDVGRPMIDSAAEKMQAINPNVEIVKHEVALSSENAMEILTPSSVWTISSTSSYGNGSTLSCRRLRASR